MDIKPVLRLMTEKNASDLFFSVGADIGIKIEGTVSPIENTRLSSKQAKNLAYSVMTKEQIDAFEQDLELDFSLQEDEFGRFRVNVFKERNEVAMVIRAIRSTIPTIEELQLPKTLKKLIMEPRGLVLVVGTAGSGKSTTLASMIDYRNQRRTGHILTIEDPIEYVYPHKKSIVNQREVGQDTQSYGTALRRAMREAPDVILIGEIRDKQTMHHAIRYAQSGHLCLSTLHAANAAQAIKRIVNFFPQTEYHKELLLDLSLNLKAVVSQRLLIGEDKKRIPAVEVMLASPYVKSLIEKGQINELDDAIEKGSVMGMQTMSKALIDLYKSEKVELQEVLRHADSSHDLLLRIQTGPRYGSLAMKDSQVAD